MRDTFLVFVSLPLLWVYLSKDVRLISPILISHCSDSMPVSQCAFRQFRLCHMLILDMSRAKKACKNCLATGLQNWSILLCSWLCTHPRDECDAELFYPPPKTNMTIKHPPWMSRCISYWKWGDFSDVMLVNSGVFHVYHEALVHSSVFTEFCQIFQARICWKSCDLLGKPRPGFLPCRKWSKT